MGSTKRIARSVVAGNDSGRTLLEWLSLRFRYCDKAAWRSYIRAGALSVGDRAAIVTGARADPRAGESTAFSPCMDPERRLQAGETVDFAPGDIREPEVPDHVTVIHDDGDFLVLHKPAGLPCHPGGRYFAHTLLAMTRSDRPVFHIATRLDRETSGLVLVCTSRKALSHLGRLRPLGLPGKRYLAVVHGAFPDHAHEEGSLVSDPDSTVRKKLRFVSRDTGLPAPDGIRCETEFRLLERARGYSLVEALPVTGRTHQIRATLLSLGFPVVGDKLYGIDEGCFIRFISEGLSESDRERLVLPAQALHCAGLSFHLPDGSPLELSSAPPWTFPPVYEGAHRSFRPSAG